ncbi:MAG: hypothetical protein ACN0LA_10005 [Candidatus Longimicrobiales bacterium M2_2A_002]
MADSARSALSDPGWARTARYELDRIDAALSLATAATTRLRRVLRAGVADSVASMMDSDVRSAGDRAQWLRERIAEEAGGGATSTEATLE